MVLLHWYKKIEYQRYRLPELTNHECDLTVIRGSLKNQVRIVVLADGRRVDERAAVQ